MKLFKAASSCLSLIACCLMVVSCGSSSDSGMAGSEATTPTTTPTINPSFSGSVSAALSGIQSVPAVATRATGTVNMQLNTTDGSLTGSIVHSVSDATVAHIHTGAIGQTGAPLVVLEATTTSQFSVPAGTVLSEEEMAAFSNGEYYVNVHSTTHPDGEIRAQLTNDVVVVPVLATLDDIQAKVFTPVCSVCHTGGGVGLPGSMDLSTADASYAALVSTTSNSVAELQRVAESDPDNSFLLDKLEGRQTVGARMPFRGTPLSDDTIAAVRAWIAAGAQR